TTAKSIETTKTYGGFLMFWKLVGVNTCEPTASSDHSRPAAMQSCLPACPSTSAQRKRVTMTLHPFNQRILAEDLVRVHRADDRERYAASQRQARIDPNPHQIDAVIFALRRLQEGGCILADEVGLGKTIEAGLVIAQSRAEGKQRVLLVVPKSLIGQWQNELANLFSIQASDDHTNFFAHGVYMVGR